MLRESVIPPKATWSPGAIQSLTGTPVEDSRVRAWYFGLDRNAFGYVGQVTVWRGIELSTTACRSIPPGRYHDPFWSLPKYGFLGWTLVRN
ncbi:hypothetical protein KPH14_003073 [Odynerus spinipes]|uniref:Uncharacterized protein n=1 Tax=Odynerus spinipes TaxID=1348599 RepID=A0AAD9VUD3_9HYME|nr:hypothetical protein KPH14_003073 [Odynerus spinipes]